MGGATIDELAVAIAKEAQIDLARNASSRLFVEGQNAGGSATVRAELAGLLASEDLFIDDIGGQLTLRAPSVHVPQLISYEQLAVDAGEIVNIKYPDTEDQVRRLDLKYAERLADYAAATAFYDSDGPSGDRANLNWPTTLDPATASQIAAAQWRNGQAAKVSYQFDLPPSLAAIQIGDVVSVDTKTLAATVNATQVGHTQRLSLAVPAEIDGQGGTSETGRIGRALEPAQSAPMIVLAQVPNADASELSTKVLAAAYAKPWPGTIRLTDLEAKASQKLKRPTQWVFYKRMCRWHISSGVGCRINRYWCGCCRAICPRPAPQPSCRD